MSERAPMKSDLERAILLAVQQHSRQVDKMGKPYILHVLRVWSGVEAAGHGEAHQIAALLHDVVEDTDMSLPQIGAMFGDEIRDAVSALTKRDGEAAGDYLKRVKANPIAAVVKFHDSTDNYCRLDAIPDEATRNRLGAKYRNVLLELANPKPGGAAGDE